MNESDARTWVAQWRAAAPAFGAVREEELGRLDESESALIASSFFLHSAEGVQRPDRMESSGLVEQQAIFLRAR